MAIIKRSHVFNKGFVDLKEEKYAAPERPAPEPETVPAREEVIKEVFGNQGSSPIVMDEIYEKAAKIISKAQEEAQEMIDNAYSEAENLRNRSKEEGLEEGKREGESKVAEQINQAMETLNEAIKQRKKIIKDAESELVRLSLKIAEQIVRSEVSLHKDVVLNIVTEAINRVSDRESIIIKVNKEDAEYIKNYKDKIQGIVDGVKNLSILEDSQVEPGGCVVETNLGYVDARISTKIELLEKALKKAESSG